MFIRYAKHSGITMRSGTATASNKSMVENESQNNLDMGFFGLNMLT